MTTFGDRLYQSGGIPVGGDVMGLVGDGVVYYVDPSSGDDGLPGTRPDRAFVTFKKAYDQIVDGRGDVIVRLPGTETITSIHMARGAAQVLSTTCFGAVD
jgi:hypothetical protein